MSSARSTPSLLIVEDIQSSPDDQDVVSSHIRLGGHPLQVILDFGAAFSGLVRYVQMPWMLGVHHPSQKAVVGLMTRFHEGKPVQLPVDLSDELAAADPPSPFRFNPAEDARLMRESASISVDLAQMHRSGTYPAQFRGVMRIGGEPLELEAALYAGPGRVPVLEWVRLPRPLTPAETDAILRGLVRELESARGAT